MTRPHSRRGHVLYLICCDCFEILNNYGQGALHFHLALSHINYVAVPAVNQEIRVWSSPKKQCTCHLLSERSQSERSTCFMIPPLWYPGKGSTVGHWETSGQDGGVGRYTLPPRTTKRRTTTNLTTKNKNCQKITPYRSPKTKKLKKKHSSRLVGGAETGSQDGED